MRTFSKAKVALYGLASTVGVLATSLVCRADADLDAFNASTTLGVTSAKVGLFSSLGSYQGTLWIVIAAITGLYLAIKIWKKVTR